MSRSTRRSASQQLTRRSSVNPNILNFSSDCDIDQKRNSQWWRNISDNSRRQSILTNSKAHPDSYKVLSTHSTITEDQNSQWWKNLSENHNVSLPRKLNNIGEQTDIKNKDLPDKILSQSESDEDEIFSKKSVFTSQKHLSQKRYSTAFNLNLEKDTEEEQNNPSHTEKQNLENEEFKNQLEDDKIKSPSKVTKGNKKKRRAKSIFSKQVVKRKFSDAFTVDDNEPEKSEQPNTDMLSQNSDSVTENVSVSKENNDKQSKEGLFKLNRKKKKYSEVFLNDDGSGDIADDIEKSSKQLRISGPSNQIQTEEMSERRKFQYDSDSSNEEIIIEEVQTQKDSSYVRNRSLHKTIEETPQKQINNSKEIANKTNLTKSTSKNKKSMSRIIQDEKSDSEASNEEIIIEDIQTQKSDVGTSNRSINVTNEVKMKVFEIDKKSKKFSEAFLIENEVDEPKIHHQRTGQISRKEDAEEIENQEKTSENSINVTKEMKPNLFKRNTKSKKYSEAFFGPSSSKILQADDNESSNEKSGEQDDKTIPSKHEKENLFTLQNKTRKFSEAFENIFEVDENKENSGSVFADKVAAKQQRENFGSLKNKAPPYSQAFMELISMQKPLEEERVIVTPTKLIATEDNVEEAAKELQIDSDTKFSSISSINISPEIKHPLFRPKARKSLYSVKSNNKQSFIHSDQEPHQYFEKNKSRRISAKRSSLRSTSPESGISKFFDESLISSTKLLINPNEDKSAGSDRSAKKKKGKPLKLVSVIHENSFNKPETDNQKSKDNNYAESEEPAKSLQKTRKSKLVTESEKSENSTDSERIQVSKGTDKISKLISKRGRKTKSMAASSENPIKEVEEQNNEIEPEEIFDSSDDEVISTRDVTPTPKKGRKSKSAPRVPKIIENKDPEFSDDPATEKKTKLNTEKSENSTDSERIQVNKDTGTVSKSTSKRGRKPKSMAAGSENPSKEVEEQNNEIEPEEIFDSSDDEVLSTRDVTPTPKKGRKSKSAPRASKIIENNDPEFSDDPATEKKTKLNTEKSENSTDSERIQVNKDSGTVSKSTSKRGRKTKSMAAGSENPSKGVEAQNNEIETEGIYDSSDDEVISTRDVTPTPKKGRKSKSAPRASKIIENNDPEFSDDPATEKKTKLNTEKSENSTDSERIQVNKDSGTVSKSTSKRGRKTKSMAAGSENPSKGVEAQNNEIETEGIYDSSDDEVISTRDVTPTPKKGQKSKSAPRASKIIKNKAPEFSDDPATEKNININTEKPENSTDSERIQVNKDTGTVSKSTSKRGRKTKSMAAGSENPSKEVEAQNNEIEPEGIYDSSDDEVISTRDVTPTPKKGQKSKSAPRASKIIKNKAPEFSDDPATEKNININTEKPENSTESERIQVNKDTGTVSKSTSKRGRKPKSMAAGSENPSKEVEEQNNEIGSEEPFQRVRKSKAVSEIYVSSDDEVISTRDVTPLRKSKSTSRASKVIENSAPETETIVDGKLEAEQTVKNKKSLRKSKSISKVTGNEMMEESKKISDKLDKNKNLSGITKLINIAEDLEDDAPNEEMIENNNTKLDKNILKRSRKSKSANNPEYLDDPATENPRKSSVTIPETHDSEEIEVQKKIVTKKSKKLSTQTNILQKKVEQDTNKSNADKISPVENIDIPSDETVERIITSYERKYESIRKTESHKNPSVDEEIRNMFQKSSKYSEGKHVESVNEKRQSSFSNVITINSSTSRARSSQFSRFNRTANKDIEKWLSQNNTNNALIGQNDLIESRNSQAFLSNFGLRAKSKGLPMLKRKPVSETDSETEEIIQDLLKKTVQEIRLEKKTKSPPQAPVKKITDFFTKLNKNEKLKPIPKTNIIKKTSKPICTARMINNKPYYSKKLFCGKRWCTPQFYKFLQNKLANEFGEETINESEKLMKYIVQSVTVVIKSKKYLKAEVDKLKIELAKYNIIETLYDFCCFCCDFLPVEYNILVIPRRRAFTAEPTVPCDPNDFFKEIEF